jgi:hypothetical protein
MRGLAIIAAIALAWAESANAQAAYSPPERDFSAVFPKPPTIHANGAADPSKPGGDRSYVDDEGDNGFLVAVSQFRDGVVPATPDAGFYQRALDIFIKASGSDKQSSRSVSLAGQPAIEGVIRTPDGSVMAVRLVARGNRVYTVAWAHPAAVTSTVDGDHFFQSFALTGQ